MLDNSQCITPMQTELKAQQYKQPITVNNVISSSHEASLMTSYSYCLSKASVVKCRNLVQHQFCDRICASCHLPKFTQQHITLEFSADVHPDP